MLLPFQKSIQAFADIAPILWSFHYKFEMQAHLRFLNPPSPLFTVSLALQRCTTILVALSLLRFIIIDSDTSDSSGNGDHD